MKRGGLNLLGRKNQSLFDTNVEIKEIDNVELQLNSSAIPESGTAKVRSRPTVKLFSSSTSSTEAVQGFAVPTPKVPVLPPFSGSKSDGTGSTERLHNGGVMTVPDFDGEIVIPPPPSTAPPPPPPSTAPPPPPPQFNPPSPMFVHSPSTYFHDRDIPDVASLQPPSMPPPKPPSKPPSLTGSDDIDLASLKPPPMAPPKPPSDTHKASVPISTPMSNDLDVPECPKFTPPLPPVEQHSTRAQKTPPPKPVRMSSMPFIDGPASNTATPTPSSFNPQNTAKLYNVPKSSFLGQIDREKKSNTILFLEDSSGKSVQVQVNGKAPASTKDISPPQTIVPPAKPARRNSSGTQLEEDVHGMKDHLQSLVPDQPTKLSDNIETPVPIGTSEDKNPPPVKGSPKIEKLEVRTTSVAPEVNQAKSQNDSASKDYKFSPLLSHKLQNLKTTEGSVPKENVASPLALLMAAKERDRQRSAMSSQNSSRRSSYAESSNVGIQQGESNSPTVTPKSMSASSQSAQDRLLSDPKPRLPVEPSVTKQKPIESQNLKASASQSEQSLPLPSSNQVNKVPMSQDEDSGEISVPFIPPPPEFANSDPEDEVEPPPSTPPPDPPVNNVRVPTKSSSTTPASLANGPSTLPKPKVPCPPKYPAGSAEVQPKVPVESKHKTLPAQAPPSVSASQATLLSILQKKMMEMDPKFAPVREVDTSGDDWGSPLSDEECEIPVPPKVTPKPKSATLPAQSHGMVLKELETKVAQRAQHFGAAAKSPSSSGPHSKQPHGLTFTVRPGTKQPITLVTKGDSPC
ncbi:pollen-specific leucine-rich repeat extensin-like protein 1 [Chanos chanos]|uniref:Pollen-specific leucine-rich repeat extensin-like protein 1 n=1 Tax=Chanos chanos TaxID=29144 RepID=A0A6J2VQT8_CHACN|nr:pollen-specific leucine-rich repeat extensin-like protein 1 [Chanos chanos]